MFGITPVEFQQKNDEVEMTVETNPLDLQVTQTAVPMLIEKEEEQTDYGNKRKNPFSDTEQYESSKRFKYVHEDLFSNLPKELIFTILNVSSGAGSNFLATCSDYQKFSKEYLHQFAHLLIKENAQFLNPTVFAINGNLNMLNLLPKTYSLYATFNLEDALQMLNKHFNGDGLKELDKIKENHADKHFKDLCDFIQIKEESLFQICAYFASLKPEEALEWTTQILNDKNLLIDALCAICTQGNFSQEKSAEILNQIQRLINSFSENQEDEKEAAILSLVKLYALINLSTALDFVTKMDPIHIKFVAYAHISLCYAMKDQFIKAWEVFNFAYNDLVSIHENDDEGNDQELYDTYYATLLLLVSEIRYLQFLKNCVDDENFVHTDINNILMKMVDNDLKTETTADALTILAKHAPVDASSMMKSLDRYCERPGIEIINGLLELKMNIEAEAFSTSKPNDADFTFSTRMVYLAHTDFALAKKETLEIECLKTKTKLLKNLAKISLKLNKHEEALKLYELALKLAKEETNPSNLISDIATEMAPYFLEIALKEISLIEDNYLKAFSINSIVEQLILKLKKLELKQ